MQKIRIFVAGAKHLKNERLSMKALANDLNTRYSRNRKNVIVSMSSYENFGDDQSAYNEFIQERADLVIFIFDGYIGKKTEEEFLLACKSYKEEKHPKVLVFLKSFSERTDDINYLERVINDNTDKYYVEYANIEDLIAKAKERISGFVRENALINTKNIRQGLARHWRKIVVGVLALLLLFGLFLMFILRGNEQHVYFNNTETPAELKESGISDTFVEQQVIDDLKTISRDARQKICSIVESEDSVDISLNTEPWAYDFRKIKKANSGNMLIRKIREFLGMHDIDVCVRIVETENAIIGHLSITKWDGGSFKKSIEKQIANYENMEKCTFELIRCCSAYIAGAYSPIVSVLYDYSSDVLDDYQMKNPWSDGLFTEAERETILLNYGQKECTDAPLAYLLLGNFYENAYMENLKTVCAETALQFYRRYMKYSDSYKESIRSKINLLVSSLQEEETEMSTNTMADRIVPTGDDCSQLLVITNERTLVKNRATFYKGDLYTFEKNGGEWKEKFPKIVVNLAQNGLVPPSDKYEGDRKTPEGYYTITHLFGYKNDINSKMPFLEVSKNHVWVSDTLSPDYNKIVVDHDGKYQSNRVNERLRRNDFLYKYAIIVDYNMQPIVKGKGGAIFIHIERQKDSHTAGCISMPEADLVKIIRWLSPENNPHIYISKLIRGETGDGI